MTLQLQIQSSESAIQWLDRNLDGLEIPATDRIRLSAGCLDVALEHQKAIVLLVANALAGSAAALLRIEFEAYVRGIWLLYSATESELLAFKNDKLKKTFQKLLDDLETHDAFTDGVLSKIKSESWGAMNSFTHSGMMQVVRRLNSEEVIPTYTDAEMIDALNSANSLGFLAAIAISGMAGNEGLAQRILDRERELFANEP